MYAIKKITWQLLNVNLRHISLRFIYVGFNVAFNTVSVMSWQLVLWAEETSADSWSRFCTVNCRRLVRNFHLSHIWFGVWTTDFRGGGGGGGGGGVLPLCHRGPWNVSIEANLIWFIIFTQKSYVEMDIIEEPPRIFYLDSCIFYHIFHNE